MRTRNILITSTAAVIAAIAIGASGAQAAGVDLFGSKSIKDDTVRSIDVKDDTSARGDLAPRSHRGQGCARHRASGPRREGDPVDGAV